MSRTVWWVLFGVAALWALSNAAQDSEPSQPAVDSVESLEVLAWHWYREYDYIHVEGQVKNITSNPLEYVAATADFYESTGTFVHSEDAFLDLHNLLPGQTTPFDVVVKGNPAYAYATIRFVLDGRELQVRGVDRGRKGPSY